MTNNQTMIEVKELTKTYGPIRALDGVSFEVRSGEVLGFLGPNGAGKTTTMKILTCFIAATSGQAMLGGMDIFKNPLEVRKMVGYLPENAPLYPDMRVHEYLNFVGEVRGLSRPDRRKAAERVVAECGLDEVVEQEIRTLSKGYRQRAGLAQAMLHNPKILILDEPTSGLDPNQIAEIRQLIRDIGNERTVILSTHHLAEVQATAGRVVIIHKGKLVADGTPEELERQQGGALYDVVLGNAGGKDGDGGVLKTFEELDGVKSVKVVSTNEGELALSVVAKGEVDLRSEIFRAVVDGGWVMLGLAHKQVDLEGIFRSLTKREGEPASGSGKEVA